MISRYDHFAVSSPGGRAENQDAHACFGFGDHGMGWVVADGLGGYAGGRAASRIAIAAIGEYFETGDPEFALSAGALDGALKAAQSAILAARKRQSELFRMHTTVVVLVSDGVIARWAHLGDSRLYHFRDGRLVAQTADHSVSYMLHLAGEIGLSEIRGHEDRDGLLRSLGSEGSWKPAILAEPVVLEPTDAFLLCSDGFWEYVLEEEMAADLAASATARDWVHKMLDRLQNRVSGQHHDDPHDNYTVVAVRVDFAPQPRNRDPGTVTPK
uniref:Serine/threonine protein phosphatase PrpC n=1 Tax=Candidatus Kentrum sp. FW TaxID=2126338 RepID=A0A450T514_9GAMM|nr:MAG: Serine/threonine protein phosphatase PrpC [Candidatus Kentron sp. FW]